MKVEKRDGTIQQFNFEKIENVIKKVFANKEINEPVPAGIIDTLKEKFDKLIASKPEDYTIPIEDIQALIPVLTNSDLEGLKAELKKRNEV